MHDELRAAQAAVYEPGGFVCSQPVPEAESAEYGAHAFTLDGLAVRFRVGKTTPTKPGQFVTVWKRPDGGGPIQPFGVEDPVDLFVISSREGNRYGHFVFPREVLGEQGVLSRGGVGGNVGAVAAVAFYAVATGRPGE